MVKGDTLKVKKGGLDTIIAYIVVMLPLLYVLVYMVATIYHFSVQTYMNQVVKEAAVMVSTFGGVTTGHDNYIRNELNRLLGKEGNEDTNWTIKYYVKRFNEDTGEMGSFESPITNPKDVHVKRSDIIGIYVESTEPSMLGNVSNFSIFGGTKDRDKLYYTSYREEIIRNERPQ